MLCYAMLRYVMQNRSMDLNPYAGGSFIIQRNESGSKSYGIKIKNLNFVGSEKWISTDLCFFSIIIFDMRYLSISVETAHFLP